VDADIPAAIARDAEVTSAIGTHEAAGNPHPTYATDTDLSDHLADAVDAHDASAISNVPAGSIAATDVQSAINELDGDQTAHLADAVDAHDASAISNVPAGSIAATTVQAAIDELATEYAAADSAHVAAADPHTGYVREADANWIDLTDAGETALHTHAGGAGAFSYGKSIATAAGVLLQ
jgi:hypothetical protein